MDSLLFNWSATGSELGSGNVTALKFEIRTRTLILKSLLSNKLQQPITSNVNYTINQSKLEEINVAGAKRRTNALERSLDWF